MGNAKILILFFAIILTSHFSFALEETEVPEEACLVEFKHEVTISALGNPNVRHYCYPIEAIVKCKSGQSCKKLGYIEGLCTRPTEERLVECQ